MKSTLRDLGQPAERKADLSTPLLSLTPTDLKRALIFKYGSLVKAADALGVSRMGLYKVLSGKVRKSHRVVKALISSFGILPESLESKEDKKRPEQMIPTKSIKPKVQKNTRRKT